MPDQIRINGNAHSWGSIILKIDGDRYHGFNSISYADKRERVMVYGMGRHHAPRGRTRGKYSCEPVKIGGPIGSAEAFRAMLGLRAVGGIAIGDVEFTITVQYIEIGTEIPITDVLNRCCLVGNSGSREENPDPLRDELEFSCFTILRNGRMLFDPTGALGVL